MHTPKGIFVLHPQKLKSGDSRFSAGNFTFLILPLERLSCKYTENQMEMLLFTRTNHITRNDQNVGHKKTATLSHFL